MICEHCNGVGQFPLDCDDAEFYDCWICGGTGERPDNIQVEDVKVND
jgi:hypothetical protein